MVLLLYTILLIIFIGSQSALNCGVDGYPFVVLTNLEHWTFAKNLCMNVHGAKHVYIFYRKLGIPGFHVEVKLLLK